MSDTVCTNIPVVPIFTILAIAFDTYTGKSIACERRMGRSDQSAALTPARL